MTLGTPDLVIVGLVLLSILIGIVRGLIKESISLITWIVAVTLAIMFASQFSEYMTFTKQAFIRTMTAFVLIFVGTVFVGAIINFLIGTLIRKTPFSVPDRILGSLFGLLRGIVLVTLLILLGGLTPFPQTSWWRESYTVNYFQDLAIWLKEQLPEEKAKVFNFPNEKKKSEVKK